MPANTARDYDNYEKSKGDAFKSVLITNASTLLPGAQEKIVKELVNLNVENLTQIEDLYLIVAQLLQAAVYMAAQKKATRRNVPFNQRLIADISIDELLVTLDEIFIKQSDTENFFKFYQIDKLYKPSKQQWAPLHARMVALAIIKQIPEKPIPAKHIFTLDKQYTKLLNKINESATKLNYPIPNKVTQEISMAYEQYKKNGNQTDFLKQMTLISSRLTTPLWKKMIEDFVNAIRSLFLKMNEEKTQNHPFKFFKTKVNEQIKEDLNEFIQKMSPILSDSK